MNPAEVVDAVTRSGLRGRGGAGYPTGLKWATVAKNQGPHKYVVCNADEGDPGAFMDRSVLESDPHRVLEGMAIAAYAVGADRATFTSGASIPWPSAGSRRGSARRGGWGCWEPRSSSRRSTSGSICGSAPAPSSAARRRR